MLQMFRLQAPSDADLKEHMVGIIFSRSKLTNLQKQVTPSKLLSAFSKTSDLPKNPSKMAENVIEVLIIYH